LVTRSKPPYCPNLGDIIWIDFAPQAGREINKRRPALVLSPRTYNSKAELCVVCPLTSNVKGYPFEVSDGADGVILVDQIRSMAWPERRAEFRSKAPESVITEVRAKLKALLGIA
jgi:mRNA interferase MazF